LNDQRIMKLLANPALDFVHHQVVMVLYSLEANHRLDDYREVLPPYLSLNQERCLALIDDLASAGLLTVGGDGIRLTHKIVADESQSGCACH